MPSYALTVTSNVGPELSPRTSVGSLLPPPNPVSMSPNTGLAAGGVSGTIAGTNFQAGATATLGGVALPVTYVSPTSLTYGPTPVLTPGAKVLVVTNGDGQSASLSNAFTVSAGVAPTLTSVTTSGGAVGDIAGGYPFTLTGTSFTGVTSVTFGGTAASFTFVNATTITGTMPAHATGAVSVIVTTPAGANGANTAFEYFSPAQLSLSEWHRASFTAAPWAANASTGASSGRTATTTGFDPTPGTAVNSLVPAHFDRASSQSLNAAVANNTLFSTGAGTFICLARTATQQAVSGTAYGDGNLLSDPSNAETTAGITSSGFVAAIYDGAYKRPTAIALANATWGDCEMVFDSSTISTRVNGGAAQSVAAGAYTPVTPSTPRMGLSYGNGYFDGDILEWMTSTTAISLANRNKIRAYLNTRYFPSGAQV